MNKNIDEAYCPDCGVPMVTFTITHRKNINVAECKEKYYWKYEFVCPECGQYKTQEYTEKLND